MSVFHESGLAWVVVTATRREVTKHSRCRQRFRRLITKRGNGNGDGELKLEVAPCASGRGAQH